MSSISIYWEKMGKEADKRTYENRKSQVTGVKGWISTACDDHVTNINNDIDELGGKIEDAITGISQVGMLVTELGNKKEKDSGSDGNISSYSGNLDSEISDCDTKIDELETEISSLETQYTNAVNQEKEAVKEAAKQVWDAIF